MRLTDFEIGPSARRELIRILADSFERFGQAASLRYEALIEQAIRDLVEDTERPGALTVNGRLHYHMRHSRNDVAGGRVREPRHILVCRVKGEILFVLAVAHDAMEEGMSRRIQEGEGR